MAVVVDASAVIALVTADPRQPTVRALFEQWIRAGEELHAPTLLPYEVSNVLARLVWDGEYGQQDVPGIWTAIHLLGINLHAFDLLSDGPRIAAMAGELRRRHATDCAYLRLSERLGLELWTLDGALARGAQDRGFNARLIE